MPGVLLLGKSLMASFISSGVILASQMFFVSCEMVGNTIFEGNYHIHLVYNYYLANTAFHKVRVV